MDDFKDAKVFTADDVKVETQDNNESTAVALRGDVDLSLIDSMIATARRYPRNVKNSLKELSEIALASPKIAASCFYKLPRAGKIIKGKSVRLAEMVQYCWGHMHSGARPVSIERDVVIAEGAAYDVQRGIRSTVIIRRSILGKNGQRYNPDMINTTMLAALSIAKREAIYDVIPEALIEDVYESAMKIAVGDIKTLPERRSEGLDAFNKMGITAEQVLASLEVDAVEDIDLEKFETMLGVYQGIKSGDVSIDEAFPPTKKPTVTGAVETLKGDAKKVGKDKPVDAKADEKKTQAEKKKEPEPTNTPPAETNKGSDVPPEATEVPSEVTTPPKGTTESPKEESGSDDPVDNFVPSVKDVPPPAKQEEYVSNKDDNDLFNE